MTTLHRPAPAPRPHPARTVPAPRDLALPLGVLGAACAAAVRAVRRHPAD
ncbi:hypothetical protein [Streptomyces sp. Isolate_219]|nr:hypothetical protein [Streptomyces sp. Isolate_219]MCR8578311.1 hypothetical protein [Streptomyces sp. Isolate_219]